jgi:hypothetical protein
MVATLKRKGEGIDEAFVCCPLPCLGLAVFVKAGGSAVYQNGTAGVFLPRDAHSPRSFPDSVFRPAQLLANLGGGEA